MDNEEGKTARDETRRSQSKRAILWFPMVREVWRGEFRFTLPELVEFANKQDYAPGLPAEGIVIRPMEEARSRILESGRLSAKIISERYALKHGE